MHLYFGVRVLVSRRKPFTTNSSISPYFHGLTDDHMAIEIHEVDDDGKAEPARRFIARLDDRNDLDTQWVHVTAPFQSREEAKWVALHDPFRGLPL